MLEKEQEAEEEADRADEADEDLKKEDIIEDTPIGEAEQEEKSPTKEDALLSKEEELDIQNKKRLSRDDSRLGGRGSIKLEAGDLDELGFDNRDIIR